jgi:hypothetical protein
MFCLQDRIDRLSVWVVVDPSAPARRKLAYREIHIVTVEDAYASRHLLHEQPHIRRFTLARHAPTRPAGGVRAWSALAVDDDPRGSAQTEPHRVKHRLNTDRLKILIRSAQDDCLPPASLGRVQRGDGIVEGRDVADVRPQSSVPHPLDDLSQLGTI